MTGVVIIDMDDAKLCVIFTFEHKLMINYRK